MTQRLSLSAIPLAFLLFGLSTADAATLTVTTLADGGAGSLREAIAIAMPGDTVEFAVTGTILLTTGPLAIGQDLVINGPGAANLAIKSGNFRAIEVSAAANVTIRDLANSSGAGIRNQGTLLLERVTVQNNFTSGGTAGILNSGSLTLRSCLLHGNDYFAGTVTSSGPVLVVESTVFRNNSAVHPTGGIQLLAGNLTVRDSSFEGNNSDGSGALTVESGATADIQRSLFSGNNGNTSGGAIINRGSTTLTNCTVTGNRSQTFGGNGGAGIRNSGTITTDQCSVVFNNAVSGGSGTGGGVLNTGTFNARNTIFARNTANLAPDFSGTLTSAGYNLIQNTSGTVIVGDTTGNLLGVDPLLGPLAQNGGPTATHAAGDPVVDAGGNAGAPATDQRGFARIVDGDGDLIAVTDMGAYERQGGDCVDADGDGFGAPVAAGELCASSVDCDDEDSSIYPGAAELCNGIDDNCDGFVPLSEADSDGDGFRSCSGDCSDSDPSRYPGAPEVCDGRDNDCNGSVPANEQDADLDRYRICDGDCNDLVRAIHPGAVELCNALDDDCDGLVPSNEQDADLDGYRICNGDCNDLVRAIHPGAVELCNALDDDCDGLVDDGATLTLTVTATPSVLWPPNHDMIPVTVAVVAGGCGAAPVVVLSAVSSSEPDDAPGGSDGSTTNDIQGVSLGAFDVELMLRAERDGRGTSPGRVYTLTYTATDAAGHTTSTSATVSVPQ